MTTRTITALFDTREEANQAIEQLVSAGIARPTISVMPEHDTAAQGTATTTSASYNTQSDDRGFWASLGSLFMPDDDRYTYAEAMHRGSIMVTANVEESQADRAEDILEQYGTVDIDARESSWREQGWQGYAGERDRTVGTAGVDDIRGTSATGMTGQASRPMDTGAEQRGDDEVIALTEEQIRIGKRNVDTGRVKVRSYVVDTPVSEQVSLRTESVHIERRPVDRAVTGSADFRERTIEARTSAEEAVISKDARVVEEVLIKKDVTDRTETVTDSVRSTKVDIDDDRGMADRMLDDTEIETTATRNNERVR